MTDLVKQAQPILSNVADKEGQFKKEAKQKDKDIAELRQRLDQAVLEKGRLRTV